MVKGCLEFLESKRTSEKSHVVLAFYSQQHIERIKNLKTLKENRDKNSKINRSSREIKPNIRDVEDLVNTFKSNAKVCNYLKIGSGTLIKL